MILRHTYAVLSLTSGAHYMLVSKWLGHESFVTTLTIYSDYIDEEDGRSISLARPVAPAGNIVPAAADVMSRAALIALAVVVLVLLAGLLWFQVLGTDLDSVFGPVEAWQE